MRFFCTLLLVIGFAFGCNTKRVAVTSSANPDFDRALGALEASADWDAANSQAASLCAGVLPAIETLRGHLANDRVISREHSFTSSVGTMGDHAFGAIRDAIYTHLPNRYLAYHAFSRSDVEDWLDRHQGKTLVELQIEAASTSLERAKRQYELNGNTDADAAIAVYTELLQARLLTRAIQDILGSDDAFSGLAVIVTRVKTVNFKIYGTIPSRSDLDRLHRRLKEELDTYLSLHWDVRLQGSLETIVGLDRYVYREHQEASEQ
ncbi:hypothetical protein [Stieleria neptunia]|nr:hypothetical protein [Stieleria neptunia]